MPCYLSLLLRFLCPITILATSVQVGLDRIDQYSDLFAGKRVGLIANHTSINSRDESIVDCFMALPEAQITALYAPEHGLWGTVEAGQDINTVMHPQYAIPIYSLYRDDGHMAKPTPAMLAPIDVLVFDIQDIGTRFYTYIWTMALAMEAAAEQHLPFVVLDRPNPVTLPVQGPLLDPNFASFKGLYPIPVVHGLTMGELARLFNQQGWLSQGIKAELKVVPMKRWSHAMSFTDTGLSFIPPSPNMRSLDTAYVYPGMALLEGTNISEGRGTDLPFLQFGTPWLDAVHVVEQLNNPPCPGVTFSTTTFTPSTSKHQGMPCRGVRLNLIDRQQLQPFAMGIRIIQTIMQCHPEQLQWRPQHFDELCGTDQIRLALTSHQSLESLRQRWQSSYEEYSKQTQGSRLYP